MVIARADDYGLLLAETRQLLGELYPHDTHISEGKVASWVEALVQGGFLKWRMTGDGARVIQVVNWDQHQKVKSPGQPILRDKLLPADHTNIKGLPEELVDLPRELVRRKGEGEGKGEVPSAAGAATPTWPVDAQAIYAEHIGIRNVREFAGQLAPAVKIHGWPAIRPWFVAYCKARPYKRRDGSIYGDLPTDKPGQGVRNTDFCSPADFVKTMNDWRDRCKPMTA